MAFSDAQTSLHAASPPPPGAGTDAISEANSVFGYAGWDRETLSTHCIWQQPDGSEYACAYLARVRVIVRAQEVTVRRDASAIGHGVAFTPGLAHERALLTAEAAATSRAFRTFGKRFAAFLESSG